MRMGHRCPRPLHGPPAAAFTHRTSFGLGAPACWRQPGTGRLAAHVSTRYRVAGGFEETQGVARLYACNLAVMILTCQPLRAMQAAACSQPSAAKGGHACAAGQRYSLTAVGPGADASTPSAWGCWRAAVHSGALQAPGGQTAQRKAPSGRCACADARADRPWLRAARPPAVALLRWLPEAAGSPVAECCAEFVFLRSPPGSITPSRQAIMDLGL